MALAPFDPADSIYDDLEADRLLHSFVQVEPNLSAGYYGTWAWGGTGRSAAAGSAVRVVWEDSGGVLATSVWVDPRGWRTLLGTNTDDGATSILSATPLPGSGVGFDNTSLTCRLEGSAIACWVAVKEFDGLGGASWTGYTKILKSDGDVSVTVGVNLAYHWRVWFRGKP